MGCCFFGRERRSTKKRSLEGPNRGPLEEEATVAGTTTPSTTSSELAVDPPSSLKLSTGVLLNYLMTGRLISAAENTSRRVFARSDLMAIVYLRKRDEMLQELGRTDFYIN